mgnify:CR=1 FL=1
MSQEIKNTIIPFGKYHGKKLDQVPLKYLDWCIGQDDLMARYLEFHTKLTTYLSLPYVKDLLEKEFEDD